MFSHPFFLLINLVSTYPARAFPGPDSTFKSGSASWTGLTKRIKGWTLFVTHLQVLNMAVLNLCSVNEVVVTMQILQGFKNHTRTSLSVLNSFFIVLASVPPIISSCLPKEHGWEVKGGRGKEGVKMLISFLSSGGRVLRSIWGETGPDLLRLSYCWLCDAFISPSLQLQSMSPKRLQIFGSGRSTWLQAAAGFGKKRPPFFHLGTLLWFSHIL